MNKRNLRDRIAGLALGTFFAVSAANDIINIADEETPPQKKAKSAFSLVFNAPLAAMGGALALGRPKIKSEDEISRKEDDKPLLI